MAYGEYQTFGPTRIFFTSIFSWLQANERNATIGPMISLHRFFVRSRFVCCTVAVLAIHLFLPTSLWAQQPTGPKVHGDTIPYLLVILSIALALILLCRSSSRGKDVRLQSLDED